METVSDAERAAHKHIFAVDHDPEFLDLVREFLNGERYVVTTTSYGIRTWQQIAALHPDLLLIDLRPQSHQAWDLLERLHAEGITSQTPVVATSTEPRLLERVRHERYGCHHVILKPLDIDALLGTIRDLIGEA